MNHSRETPFSAGDIRNLAEMLDPNLRYEESRPKEQRIGYSLNAEEGAAGPNATASPTPGGIALPSTAIDIQIGLPVPSMSKAGKELQQRAQRRTKLVGDEIWAPGEVVELAQTATSMRIAPIPARADAAKGHPTGNADARGRVPPEYDVRLLERVGAEDVYLGVDFERDGSSASAAGVVIKFQLPLLSSAKEIKLSVEPYTLKLETPEEYIVSVPLPLKCVENIAKAQWDATARVLTVTTTPDPDAAKVKVI